MLGKRRSISQNNELHSSTSNRHIHTAQIIQEPDLSVFIGAYQAYWDNIPFLTLETIHGVYRDELTERLEESILSIRSFMSMCRRFSLAKLRFLVLWMLSLLFSFWQQKEKGNKKERLPSALFELLRHFSPLNKKNSLRSDSFLFLTLRKAPPLNVQKVRPESLI